jgi:hypothetical protein
VKIVFLHGELKEEICVSQHEDFVASGKEDFVFKLKRSLYSLK